MAEPTQPSGPDRHRRRLVRGGLGAAPLLTLISRPVLGNGIPGQCFAPSAFVSMPTSQHGQPQVCMGRTPGYWKIHAESWPDPYFATTSGGHVATTFNSVFGLPSPYSNETTLLTALDAEQKGYSGPPHDVARHIVAALLNVAAGWAPVLSITVVQAIWREYLDTGGYFEPRAGVKWDHEQIVAYLLTTMPV